MVNPLFFEIAKTKTLSELVNFVSVQTPVVLQFMVWVGDIEYTDFKFRDKFTLVFGEVTHGLKHLQEMSRIGMMYSGHETWLLKEDIIIKRCGVL